MLFFIINLTNYYIKPPLTRALIYLDLQFQRVLNSLTIRTELDFQSEYVFRRN